MATLADLQHRIHSVRARERRVIAISGFCRSLVTFILVIIAYFLLDWIFDLPYAARIVAVVIGAGFIGRTVYIHFIRELQKINDDDEIALRIESRNPELRGRLISTIQLARAKDGGTYIGSNELLEALETETVRMSEPLDFSRVISTDMMKKLGVAALIIVAVKAALLFKFSDHFTALADRLVHANAKFPTKTRIKEVKALVRVPRGEALPVEVILDPDSEIPSGPGSLSFEGVTSGSNVSVELLPAGENVYKGTLANALEDVKLRVAIGDARTDDPILIKVVPRPEVDTQASGQCIQYTLPAYTGEPTPQKEKFGGLVALVGSKAEIQFVSTKPLQTATMVRSDGKNFSFSRLDGSGVMWGLKDLPIDVNGRFHISLFDFDGLENSQPAIDYPIDARPDQAPYIKLLKPSKDRTVTPNARLNVSFTARDDFYVRTVWVVYRVQSETAAEGTGEIKRVERKLPEKKKGTIDATFVFDLAEANVKVGDQVTLWLEADDDCNTNDNPPAARRRRAEMEGNPPTTAPDPNAKNYSHSADVKLSVISREDKALEIQQEIERIVQLLTRQKENQEDLKKKVQELLEERGLLK